MSAESLAGALVLAAAAAAAFALLTALLGPVAFRLLRAARSRVHPAARAHAALGAATAPLWLPAVGAALCLLPSLLAGVGLHDDHCVRHGEHAHLCPWHARIPVAPGLLALAAVGMAAPAVAAVHGARLVRRARGAGRALGPAAHGRGEVVRIESDVPWCGAAGLWRPRILLSTGLDRLLGPAERAVVLAHERAHVRRRDGLRALVARAASLAHVPAARRALLAEHELACEQACDEEAALRVRDRVRVAETLLAVERRLGPRAAAAPGTCGFGESTVPERVHALLAEPPARAGRRVGGLAAALLVLGAAAGADALHHAAEHGLALLLR